jgi:hypothetical protein
LIPPNYFTTKLRSICNIGKHVWAKFECEQVIENSLLVFNGERDINIIYSMEVYVSLSEPVSALLPKEILALLAGGILGIREGGR